jgi:maltooligosyltrehalose synthase
LLSTYRLQLTPTFGFSAAAEILDHLEELGVTDVYVSPILQAARGSTHGYDVVDHSRISEALGGMEGFASLSDGLRARSLGLLVDWVPNHMGVASGQNPWWPVDGATGYDFAATAIGLLVDRNAESALNATYTRFTHDQTSYSEHVYRSKLQILRYSLASEVNMLARSLERIAALNRHFRDFTLISLTNAIVEVLAAFPVYRTYLRAGHPPSKQDERHVHEALEHARRRNPAISPSVFDFLEHVLLVCTPSSEAERDAQEAFALRFQVVVRKDTRLADIFADLPVALLICSEKKR